VSRQNVSLRWRVTIAATLVGVVLSLMFAGMTVFVSEQYEDVLVGELLQGQAQDYSLRLATDPNAALPQSHRLSGYLRRKDGSGAVPADLAPLGPGFYDDDPRLPDGIHAGVYDIDQGRLYFAVDLSDIEATETLLAYVIVAVFVVGTSLSAWLGWLLGGASLAPLRRLAHDVNQLPIAPQRTSLSNGMVDDELGRLASAIDGYQARLVEADAQERHFFADASHELRTPIAVVRGVAEVILDDPEAGPGMRRRLGRLERGIGELGLLLDVLLGLARRRALVVEAIDAAAVFDESLGALSGLGGREKLSVHNDLRGDWLGPRREVGLLLQGALRRLLAPDAAGVLRVSRDGDEVSLHFMPQAADAVARLAGVPRSDTGHGLTLVDRLAQSMGWKIEAIPAADGARELRITAPAAAPPVA
jgi:signal transduction histidine kinase